MLARGVDLAVITETWLSEFAISSAELSCEGRYAVFRKDRSSRGGGVAILLNADVPHADVTIEHLSSEVVACDILLGDRVCRLIAAYFSPTGLASALVENMKRLVDDLEKLMNVDLTTIITGDLNQPRIDWEHFQRPMGHYDLSKEEILLDFCVNYGLRQLVTEATRTTQATSSILDVVLCNDDSVPEVAIQPSPIRTDHSLLCFSIDTNVPANVETKGTCLNYEAADYQAMMATLDSINWYAFYQYCTGVDEMYQRLIRCLHTLIDRFVPNKKVPCNLISKHLLRLCSAVINPRNEKHRLYLQAQIDKTVRRQRIIQERAILSQSNRRSIYSYIKKRIVVKDSLAALRRADGSLATDDFEKAELLKKYFEASYPSYEETVARKLDEMPEMCRGPLQHVVERVDFSPQNILKHLRRIKCTTSDTPDKLPSVFLKKLGMSLCVPLSLLFERCFNDASLPDIFRTAIIYPVHKKGAKVDPANKRPLSLTVVACKIMESIICEAIYENANSQGLISSVQFAYRPGFNTTLHLLDAQFEWAQYHNASHPFDVIFFDFKSAFEGVTHAKLLSMLHSFGIGSKIIALIKEFLRERTFCVRVNKQYSTMGRATSGCPQGTVFGPLMFILYINSVAYILPPTVSVKVYADDIKIYGPVSSSEEQSTMHQALERFTAWADGLDLALSTHKCAVLHFGKNNPNQIYYMKGQKLNPTTVVKDLGVLTSSTFKYSEHITNVALNASRRANWILRAFIVNDPGLYIKLFSVYVRPILTYASPVWRPGLKKDQQHLDKIVKHFIQRVARKCDCDINALDNLSISAAFDAQDRCVFKAIESKHPTIMSKMFYIVESSTRSTRNVIPNFIAKKRCINDLFTWRLSRDLRM